MKHPLDGKITALGLNIFWAKRKAAWLNGMVMAAKRSIGTKEVELRRLKGLIGQYKLLLSSNAEKRLRFVRLTGLSIPDLVALIKIYDQRVKNALDGSVQLHQSSSQWADENVRSESQRKAYDSKGAFHSRKKQHK